MDMFYFCNDGVWDDVDGGRTFAAVTPCKDNCIMGSLYFASNDACRYAHDSRAGRLGGFMKAREYSSKEKQDDLMIITYVGDHMLDR